MMTTGQHSDPPQGKSVRPITVRVLLNARAQWEVLLPNRRRPLRCRDLDEAERVAYVFAEGSRPCEVLVHDAYHRVVRRDLINGHAATAGGVPAPADANRISAASKTNA